LDKGVRPGLGSRRYPLPVQMHSRSPRPPSAKRRYIRHKSLGPCGTDSGTRQCKGSHEAVGGRPLSCSSRSANSPDKKHLLCTDTSVDYSCVKSLTKYPALPRRLVHNWSLIFASGVLCIGSYGVALGFRAARRCLGAASSLQVGNSRCLSSPVGS